MERKKENLVGETFGRWKVIEKINNSSYLCQCSCKKGTMRKVNKNHLKDGSSKSCGCINKERLSERAKENKNFNRYEFCEDCVVGYASNTHTKFFFDKEDFETVRQYYWRENERGYIVTTINNFNGGNKPKVLFLHSLFLPVEKGVVVDHKDLNKINNKRENLRYTTQQDNIINREKQRNNSSGYTGVSWDKKSKCWRGHISKDHKSYCAFFKNIEDAIAWRESQENILFKKSYRHIKEVNQ